MTWTATRMASVCATTFLVGVYVAAVPTAAAVTPPPVDDALLPKPGAPTPPRPTKQQEQCITSTRSGGEPRGAGQLDGLDLPSMWKLTRGAGQTVAVIDTGVSRHRLLPHLVPGGDYVSTGDGTDDCDGHGTVVAGIIGAAETDGFSGIAPDATIISIRQSSNKFRASEDASGAGFGDVDTLAMAVRTAADMGATVINVSSVACLGAESELDDRALGAALAYAVDVKNVVVVAAAGNVGAAGQCPEQNPGADPARPGQPDWATVKVVVSPAWYDDYVLTVGSVDKDGVASQFSLAGPWVDVAAPGQDVVSLDPGGEGLVTKMPTFSGATPIAGTSFSAPVVSGIAALVRSRSPELTARQVMQRIEGTAHRSSADWDPVVGYGLVDPLAAVTNGSASTPLPKTGVVQSVSHPANTSPDTRPRDVAVRGTAICLAVSIATVAMTVGAARLRRPRETVAND